MDSEAAEVIEGQLEDLCCGVYIAASLGCLTCECKNVAAIEPQNNVLICLIPNQRTCCCKIEVCILFCKTLMQTQNGKCSKCHSRLLSWCPAR